jgi:hypothetical protein
MKAGEELPLDVRALASVLETRHQPAGLGFNGLSQQLVPRRLDAAGHAGHT